MMACFDRSLEVISGKHLGGIHILGMRFIIAFIGVSRYSVLKFSLSPLLSAARDVWSM